jgi:hypothetical protein
LVYIYISWHLSPSQRRTLLVCLCMCIPPSLLVNESVKTLPRQQIHMQQQKNCWTGVFYMRFVSS